MGKTGGGMSDGEYRDELWLAIKKLRAENEALRAERDALKAKIDGGVRVQASPHVFKPSWLCSHYENKDYMHNAILILDEAQ